MENHFELTDDEFENQIKNCRLDPEIFSHEAHLRLAWIHITRYGIKEAIINLQDQLQSFANYHGARSKYNKTLTIAAARAVYHFMLRSDARDFQNFIAEYPRLKFKFRELIDSHYGFDIFTSREARQHYLEPDLLPFD